MHKTLGIVPLTAWMLAMPIAEAKEWSFDVWLDKQKIGTHTFSLDQNRLQSRARFKVKVLFINAYRYQHQADETWQGQCLSQLTAHTEENKEITDVRGQQQDDQFVIEQKTGRQSLPACVMTFAYWNPEILKQTRLLNPQNAEYLDVTLTDEGRQTIQVKGQYMVAHQYRLNGKYQGKEKLKITVWYDEQQDWVALESITPEGYKIIYKLI
ncbi:DUF6134 family protein [Methylophilus sp. UBA6697]|jgi:hypothetical protein|uniref:DUF6134 family protein n=1 Tax=Methylophilus sp. UBA6697 TaxID=1946902 RepID=UPI000EC55DB8|nr:DUF6134 family protein [Methylophilus sp. UBA6697]HCU85030.1 hypothetical protein [Methylophilus sp.]